MLRIEFKEKAAKELDKLPPHIKKRILEKLKFYSLQKSPFAFAQKLTDFRFGQYQFRIGDYRILFDVQDDSVIILKLGHRKEVYK